MGRFRWLRFLEWRIGKQGLKILVCIGKRAEFQVAEISRMDDGQAGPYMLVCMVKGARPYITCNVVGR